MSDKRPDIHDVNRLNDYEERDAWDMFLDIWTSKLGIFVIGLIITALMGLGVFLAFGYWDITIVWGETEVVAVLAIFGALGLGGWFIVLPMLKLSSTPFEILIRLNSTHDSILDAWVMHPVRLAKVSVTEGRAATASIRGVPVYFVREYNPKTREAKGTWRGEMNDIELETHVEAMKQNRGKLRRWAQIGQQLYAKFPAIATAVETAYWRAMSDDSIKRKARHPEVIESEVYDSVEMLIDSIELPGEGEPDAEEMFDEAAENEVGDIPDEWGGSE